MNPVFQGLLTILIGVGGIFAYFVLSNMLLDKVLFPAKGPNAVTLFRFLEGAQ